MARSRVNRDISFSPFEMVYGYKPKIVQLPQSIKLIEPKSVPKDEQISDKLKRIREIASQQANKRMLEQGIQRTEKFQINDEVWAINPDKRKLSPLLIGPYTVIMVNEKFNTCCIQDANGKQQDLHMDSLCIVKARQETANSNLHIPKDLLEKFGACKVDSIPKFF